MKNFTQLFIVLCCSVILIFPQSNSISDAEIKSLLQNVIEKSKKHRVAFLSEYQHSYKYSIEIADSGETKSWVYEQYCLNEGKFFCQMVLIEKNGVAVSKSQIKKARRKVAQNLSKMENLMKVNDTFGYGTTMGNVWVDPTVYLRDCQIISFAKTNVSTRETAVVEVENCNIEKEPIEWKPALSFMNMTKATIWIDVEDKAVKQMNVYAGKDFAKETKNEIPLIKMENSRMREGFWLFKTVRLETIGNEKIFPNLKNNYQYEFFDYKRLSVDVESPIESAN